MIGNVSNVSAFGFEFGAVTTVDINSQKVFRDVAFSWARRFTIGVSATVDILIDPTNVTVDDLVVLPISFSAFGAGPINGDMYFGVDADADGTLWDGGNRDHTSSTKPKTIVRLSPTINNVGVKTDFEFMIPSDGVPAVASFGGATKDDLIFKARLDGKYMIRLVNTEANIAQCSFTMTVFEPPIGA